MSTNAKGPSAKGRRNAINAIRSRLNSRAKEDELWSIVWDYRFHAKEGHSESRAAALVIGAILEQGLDRAILSHCINMSDADIGKLFGDGQSGSFLTFATKIWLGYALGIFGTNSRDDLDTIRHIRNLFAHEKRNLTFSDEVVISACDELKCIHDVPWGGVLKEPTNALEKYAEAAMHFFIFFCGSYEGQETKPISYMTDDLRDLYS